MNQNTPAAAFRSVALAAFLTVLTITRAYCLWDTIVLPEGAPASVRLAAADLQWYLGAVSTQKPRIVSASDKAGAVLLGPEAAQARIPGWSLPYGLGGEGYVVQTRRSNVICAGSQPAGTVYAVYDLLRELGFFFTWGDDALPRRLPDSLPDLDLRRKPAFAIRGSLPWYNFFDSPTTWDPADYRKFFDRQIRMGNNFIGFHVYDTEPFTPAPVDGKVLLAEPLHTTADPTWGTVPMQASEFAFGTDRLFDGRYFGAAAAARPGSREQKIARQQQMLSEALTYAHQRGLKTCLGFEVGGDPTDPAEQKVFISRLRHLLQRYPMLDYVWLWQPEGAGLWGSASGIPKAGSALGSYAELWQQQFKRLVLPAGEMALKDVPGVYHQQNAKRLVEGARLAIYAMLAHHELEGAPGVRLVISGWGGEDRLLSAEYYEGLDRLLPRDVIFSSLDHIFPRDRVDRIYHELPSSRQRWPIVWFENDGDQWYPQPFVSNYEKIAADALAAGCQGILGIHWRTRDVEENAGYLAAVSWAPGLSSDSYFDDWARRLYGPSLAPEMASVHKELNALGYRWIGGGGQMECGGFTWSPAPDPAQRTKLEALRVRLDNLIPVAMSATDAPLGASERIRWLIATARWAVMYDDAARAAASGTPDAQKLADAMRTYASKITSRGELGVLATINAKAWARLRTDMSDAAPAYSPDVPMSNLCKGPEPPDTVALVSLHPVRFPPLAKQPTAFQLPPTAVRPQQAAHPLKVVTRVSPGMAVLHWGPAPPGVAQWKVYRSGLSPEKLVTVQDALALVQCGARILLPQGGDADFSIRAVYSDKREEQLALVHIAGVPNRSETGPSVSLGPADLRAAAYGRGSSVPASPSFDIADQATVIADFRADSTQGIPLIVSHGIWNVSGWFLQMLEGRIRFYIHGLGTLDAGPVEPGQQYRLAAIYTGAQMQVYLNGQLQGTLDVQGEASPDAGPLYIGRYAYEDSHYFLKGEVLSVTIYPYALDAGDARLSP